jgi:hypothetical protein
MRTSLAARLTRILALLGALAALARSAAAAERAELAYEREPALTTCPDEGEMRERVAARLGYDPFEAGAGRRVTVRLRRVGRSIEGLVAMRDASGAPAGERRVSSAAGDCRELGDALAFTVALLVDPRAAMGEAPAASSPPSSAPPASSPSPREPSPFDEPPPPAAPAPPREGLRVVAVAEATLSAGTVPEVSPGLAAGSFLAARRWAIGLEIRGDLPAEARDGDRAVRAWLLAANVVPCGRLGVVLLCAVASVGALQGSSVGPEAPASNTTLHLALGPRLGVWVPLTDVLSVGAHADALFQLGRAQLVVGDVEIWSSPVLAGIVAGGAQVHFP